MDSSSPVKVAAAQVGSVLFNVPSTLAKVDKICRQAAGASIRLADCPTDFEPVPDTALIRGGSMIVSPFGEVLAGPLEGREGLVAATIDLKEISRGKFDLDVAGHYARPDVFSLTVDLGRKVAVSTENAAEQCSASASPQLAQGTRLRS